MNIKRAYFGKWLQEKRLERGLTQGQVAQKLELSGKIVSLWEGGFTAVPIERIFSLVEIYDIDMKELLEKLKEYEPDIYSRFMMLKKGFTGYLTGLIGTHRHHRPFSMGRHRRTSDNRTYVNQLRTADKLGTMYIMSTNMPESELPDCKLNVKPDQIPQPFSIPTDNILTFSNDQFIVSA